MSTYADLPTYGDLLTYFTVVSGEAAALVYVTAYVPPAPGVTPRRPAVAAASTWVPGLPATTPREP